MVFKNIPKNTQMIVITRAEYNGIMLEHSKIKIESYRETIVPSCAILMPSNELDFITSALQRAKSIIEYKLATEPTEEIQTLNESLKNYTLGITSANNALKKLLAKKAD